MGRSTSADKPLQSDAETRTLITSEFNDAGASGLKQLIEASRQQSHHAVAGRLPPGSRSQRAEILGVDRVQSRSPATVAPPSPDWTSPVGAAPPKPNWTPLRAPGDTWPDSPDVNEASDQDSLADDDWMLR